MKYFEICFNMCFRAEHNEEVELLRHTRTLLLSVFAQSCQLRLPNHVLNLTWLCRLLQVRFLSRHELLFKILSWCYDLCRIKTILRVYKDAFGYFSVTVTAISVMQSTKTPITVGKHLIQNRRAPAIFLWFDWFKRILCKNQLFRSTLSNQRNYILFRYKNSKLKTVKIKFYIQNIKYCAIIKTTDKTGEFHWRIRSVSVEDHWRM